MIDEVEITKTFKLCFMHNEHFESSIWFEYIERSPAHFFSDTSTDVDIDKGQAIEIIELLNKAFDLNYKVTE